MNYVATTPDTGETCPSADELERFCQIVSSLVADSVSRTPDDGLPRPLHDIIKNLRAVPICDRLDLLGNQLQAIQGVDVDAVLYRVFAIDPRDPNNKPPATIPTASPTPIPFPFPASIVDEKREMESDGFETHSLATILAMEDTGIDWLVERLIPMDAVAILGGYAGQGKSWMMMDLALSVIAGLRWLGRFPTRQGGVLYVDEESGIKLLRHRLGKLVNARGEHHSADSLEFVVQKGLCLADKKSLEALRCTIARTKPILVIIDSLIRVHGSEENSASDMARVFAEVKRIVRDFGCSVLFADHQKKPGIGATSQDLLLRGTTEKVAFVDSLISLSRKNGVLVVEHSKSRFAQPLPSFVIEIEDPATDQTVVRMVGDAEEIQRQTREEQGRELVSKLLADGSWKPRRELAESAKKAGVPVKNVDAVLKSQVEQELIEREDRKPESGKGNKTAYYRKKPGANSVSDFQSIIDTGNGNGIEMGSGGPNGTLCPLPGGDT